MPHLLGLGPHLVLGYEVVFVNTVALDEGLAARVVARHVLPANALAAVVDHEVVESLEGPKAGVATTGPHPRSPSSKDGALLPVALFGDPATSHT